jgi:hypothetical protein
MRAACAARCGAGSATSGHFPGRGARGIIDANSAIQSEALALGTFADVNNRQTNLRSTSKRKVLAAQERPSLEPELHAGC